MSSRLCSTLAASCCKGLSAISNYDFSCNLNSLAVFKSREYFEINCNKMLLISIAMCPKNMFNLRFPTGFDEQHF